jgi:putative transposase
LALQIAGVYQLTIHSALEKTPLEAWREGVSKRKQPIRYPANGEELFLDFLPAVSRLIQKDGIHFHKIRYWSSVLSPWAGRRKEPLLVKYDPRNLSRLYLCDPNGRHWAIPYADLGQPPIALWELLEARQRLRQSGSRDESERALFNHILEQRRIVRQAAASSHQRRRVERGSRSIEAAATPEKAPLEPSELKPYPVEIWEAD